MKLTMRQMLAEMLEVKRYDNLPTYLIITPSTRMTRLSDEINDALCPPFTSHGASIMLAHRLAERADGAAAAAERNILEAERSLGALEQGLGAPPATALLRLTVFSWS
jgi:hypothetical protein